MHGNTLFAEVCDPATLQQAWLDVRGKRSVADRQRGAGVDGVTVADWERDSAARLAALRDALRSGTYQPSPLRWFDVPRRATSLRPQVNGRPNHSVEMRRLGIPTVTDRVAQRAVKQVLEPLWEPVFLSCSHGYRPNRSVFTAVAHILWHQAQGLTWVVDADIADYFNTVEHTRLLELLACLEDEQVLRLIAAWLEAGASYPGLGIAQGSVISPLLANIFLHPFDTAMIAARWALVRYADDFVIMCPDEGAARVALVEAADALAAQNLALNGDKTTIVPFGPDFEFLGARFYAS